MKHLAKTLVLVATVCAALAGCADNEFTRTSTRAQESAAEQLCGGSQVQPLRSAGAARNSDQHNFCVQEMQGDDRQG